MISFKINKKGKTGKTGNYEFRDELTKYIKIIYSTICIQKKGKTGKFEFDQKDRNCFFKDGGFTFCLNIGFPE